MVYDFHNKYNYKQNIAFLILTFYTNSNFIQKITHYNIYNIIILCL